MIAFWIVAAVMSAGAAWLMAASGARAARVAAGEDPARTVYRRQLAEIDDLVQRGLIGEAEARTARAETGRRLLRAVAAADPTPRRASPRLMLALTALTPIAAVAAYLLVGRPDLPDQPYARRIDGWMANPSALAPAQMAAILRHGLRRRPDDLILLRNLANYSVQAGDTGGAVRAMRRAVAISPRDADLWVALGEALMLDNEGRLDPASRHALEEALRLRPGFPEARYALGRGQIAAGDLAGGLAAWRALAADLPENDPHRAQLIAEVDQVQRWGGLQPPGGAAAGPTPTDAAIRAMVDGLARRLAANPDDPEGWVRLVRAYTVLGDTGRRDEALTAARARYRDRPDVLRALDAALQGPPAP